MMPLVSWVFAGDTSIASGMPYFSTAIWILMPLIFLPPSMPRMKQARRRAAGAAVDHQRARLRGVAAGEPPGPAQPVEQPAPQPEPGPAGEQRVKRAERDAGELADGAPLHAAEAGAPDRHDRFAQLRPGQRRLGPGPCRSCAIRRHGGEFHQDLVHEGVDVGERIPGGRSGLCGTGGGAHMLRIRWLSTGAADIPLRPPDVTPLLLKVASGPTPPGTTHLQTDSEPTSAG